MPKDLTNMGMALVGTEYEARLDAACKALLSDKQVLAHLLKGCAEEYADCSIEEIMECIEGEPLVSRVGMERDISSPPKIQGMLTEDVTLHEGVVKYDVLFRSRLPHGNGLTELIVNVEAQNDFRPGYSLVTRGIYYVSRLISAQKNVRFEGSDYQNITKVYSIWVCINPAEDWKDTLTLYRLKEENLVGNAHEARDAYDKLCIVIVGLGKGSKSSQNPLLDMLKVLLDADLSAGQKMQELQKYGIQSTKSLEGRATDMCNFSKGVLEKGREEGRVEGREEGLQQGVFGLISTLIEMGGQKDFIVSKVAEKCQLTIEEAQDYYTEYLHSHS